VPTADPNLQSREGIQVKVIIGVDPHKASHTAVAVDDREDEISRVTVRATRRQLEQLQQWAAPFEERVWAIESAGGLGYLLAQQLVGAGEQVMDVPATLAARVRVLGTGRSNKNDPNDARSVAVAALRSSGLVSVQAADHVAVLRLLVKRNLDLGRERNRVACRLHVMIAELVPGGIAKELTAPHTDQILAAIRPVAAVDAARLAMAHELLADLRRLDAQKADLKRRIATAVRASKTSVTDVFCVGPITAGLLIAYSGDVRRFGNRHRFAAYNGTAPIEVSSAGRVVHRLSRRGNRTLNYAIHMVAIGQIRHPGSEGRAFYDRKLAESKTKREALRALKRRVSDAVYHQLMLDADRHQA
jgi:transposase